MKKILPILFLTIIIQIQAQEQPWGWRGDRLGNYNQTGLLKEWPEGGPKLLWSIGECGKGYSSPVIYGEMIYLSSLNEDASSEVLSAYTIGGDKLWSTPYGRPWTKSFPETRTTPTLYKSKLYVISGIGDVTCIDASDGKVVWSEQVGDRFKAMLALYGAAESPLIVDDKVIYTPGGEITTIVALDAATGKLVWQSESYNQENSYVSPVIINHNGVRQIVTCTGDYLVGVNPEDGKIVWKVMLLPESKRYYPDGKRGDTAFTNCPIYSNGKVYVTSGHEQGSMMIELNADATDARIIWTNETQSSQMGGAILIDSVVYAPSWQSNSKGNWTAVDWRTGVTLYDTTWRNKGCLIAADGLLYCYEDRTGWLALVRPNPEKFEVISEFRITLGDGPHWSHPVIDRGILYLRHGNALMAYKIKTNK